MTQTAYPFAGAQGLNQDQWARMLRRLLNGVVGDPLSTDLSVTGDGSGMHVFVAVGDADNRGFHFQSDATVTVNVNAASSQPRIDRIVLRLDQAAGTIVVGYLPGVAGTTPIAPALTQVTTGVWEYPLARVAVNPVDTNIPAGRPQDERLYAGQLVQPVDLANPLQSGSPSRTGIGLDVRTHQLWVGDGTQWVTAAAPQIVSFTGVVNATVNNAQAVDKTMSFTVQHDARVALVAGMDVRLNAGPGSLSLSLFVDGATVDTQPWQLPAGTSAASRGRQTLQGAVDVAAGTHSILLRAYNDSVTGSLGLFYGYTVQTTIGRK